MTIDMNAIQANETALTDITLYRRVHGPAKSVWETNVALCVIVYTQAYYLAYILLEASDSLKETDPSGLVANTQA